MSESSKFVLLIQWQSGASEQLPIPSDPWPGRSCPPLEVGPRDQEPCATVPVYANDGPTLCEVIVHGVEIPSMLVCPAPPAKPEPCPDCGTPMVDVIPSLSRTRQSLPMCPQCHPVTCHDGTIVAPLGPYNVRGERLSQAPEAPPGSEIWKLAFAGPTEATPEWLAEFMAELGRRHLLRTVEGCQAAAVEARLASDAYGLQCRSCAALARAYEASGQCVADIASGDQGAWLGHHEAATRHFREAAELARQGEEIGA